MRAAGQMACRPLVGYVRTVQQPQPQSLQLLLHPQPQPQLLPPQQKMRISRMMIHQLPPKPLLQELHMIRTSQ